MAPRLVIESGPDAGHEIQVLANDCTTIGRCSTSTVFLHNDLVAKNHARFWLRGGFPYLRCYTIKDGYTTLLNGNKVTPPFDVTDGDLLQIGDVEIRFRAT